ncbi:MAG TPA: hypothetical protein VLS45_00710 [Methylomicrobium sp.]|nr:hypothetical protein [Methylomicrobium sp.]
MVVSEQRERIELCRESEENPFVHRGFLTCLHEVSGLAAAILRFRCRTMSAGVGGESTEMVDPKNLVVAVEISILSVTEQDIQLLPVWRPPFCVSGVGRCRRMLAMSPLR